MSPRIENNRLLLRPWQDDDAPLLYRYASDPDVGPRAGWAPHQSVEESLHIIQTVFRNPTTWAIVRKENDGLKVLGGGELTKKLTVKAAKFSAAAKEKIEAAGGSAEEV